VETLTRPPQTPVQPRSIAEARRRWPRRLLTVIVTLLCSVVVAAAVWVMNVEPLARGSVGYAIDDRSLRVTERNVDALGASGTIQTLAMQRGMSFTYRFSLTNDGPVPITILGIGLDDGDDPIAIRLAAAKPDLRLGAGPMDGFGPFEPFAIASGDEAGLEVRVHVGGDACYAPGSSAVIWQLPVTYRILGITRHGWVDTGTEIRLTGNRGTAC